MLLLEFKKRKKVIIFKSGSFWEEEDIVKDRFFIISLCRSFDLFLVISIYYLIF